MNIPRSPTSRAPGTFASQESVFSRDDKNKGEGSPNPKFSTKPSKEDLTRRLRELDDKIQTLKIQTPNDQKDIFQESAWTIDQAKTNIEQYLKSQPRPESNLIGTTKALAAMGMLMPVAPLVAWIKPEAIDYGRQHLNHSDATPEASRRGYIRNVVDVPIITTKLTIQAAKQTTSLGYNVVTGTGGWVVRKVGSLFRPS